VQKVTLPGPGQWDVRVTKIGSGLAQNTVLAGENADKRVAEETWLVNINEISNDAFSYPNQALLDIRALATDQLSGNGINVTAVVDAGDPESLGYKHSVGVDQPSLYWRLGETAGATTAVDSSIYGKNGTYSVSGITLGKDSLLNRAPTTSALFDGTALSPASASPSRPPSASTHGSSRRPSPAASRKRPTALPAYSSTPAASSTSDLVRSIISPPACSRSTPRSMSP